MTETPAGMSSLKETTAGHEGPERARRPHADAAADRSCNPALADASPPAVAPVVEPQPVTSP
jgi:hypothetical protein